MNYVIVVASCLIAVLETSIFQHYSNCKNYWANFDDNCKIYSKEVLVIEINGMINSDKFSRSYDDLYLGVTCLGHRVVNLLFFFGLRRQKTAVLIIVSLCIVTAAVLMNMSHNGLVSLFSLTFLLHKFVTSNSKKLLFHRSNKQRYQVTFKSNFPTLFIITVCKVSYFV